MHDADIFFMRVLKLIRKYSEAGVMTGVIYRRVKKVPHKVDH